MKPSRTSNRLILACLWVVGSLLSQTVSADTAATARNALANRFFTQYCTQCHGETNSKGMVALAELSFEATTPENLRLWERVLEAIQGLDMPPAAYNQCAAAITARREIVVNDLHAWLSDRVEPLKSRIPDVYGLPQQFPFDAVMLAAIETQLSADKSDRPPQQGSGDNTSKTP